MYENEYHRKGLEFTRSLTFFFLNAIGYTGYDFRHLNSDFL